MHGERHLEVVHAGQRAGVPLDRSPPGLVSVVGLPNDSSQNSVKRLQEF